MPEAPTQPAEEVVDLKDPVLAAFLAWLIPGLGHLYQGRLAKAVLFFVCIMSTFAYGVYLSSDREMGVGRAVYFSWRDNDLRLAYLCQVGVGLSALPAIVQAHRMDNNKKVWWHGFMAPPLLTGLPNIDHRENQNLDQPDLNILNRRLHRFFELGTVFTMIAGLLNILAIYDAFGGPVPIQPKKDEKPAADAKPTS